MDSIILYILIISVSFFCAGIFRKRFEENLPLSFILLCCRYLYLDYWIS